MFDGGVYGRSTRQLKAAQKRVCYYPRSTSNFNIGNSENNDYLKLAPSIRLAVNGFGLYKQTILSLPPALVNGVQLRIPPAEKWEHHSGLGSLSLKLSLSRPAAAAAAASHSFPVARLRSGISSLCGPGACRGLSRLLSVCRSLWKDDANNVKGFMIQPVRQTDTLSRALL